MILQLIEYERDIELVLPSPNAPLPICWSNFTSSEPTAVLDNSGDIEISNIVIYTYYIRTWKYLYISDRRRRGMERITYSTGVLTLWICYVDQNRFSLPSLFLCWICFLFLVHQSCKPTICEWSIPIAIRISRLQWQPIRKGTGGLRTIQIQVIDNELELRVILTGDYRFHIYIYLYPFPAFHRIWYVLLDS